MVLVVLHAVAEFHAIRSINNICQADGGDCEEEGSREVPGPGVDGSSPTKDIKHVSEAHNITEIPLRMGLRPDPTA